ncbi:hypothetical protein ACLKA6_017038 [Drosophila palustris]
MAKKGGVQQLQADISSDEEFEKFLQRPGLLVLDIYSEWCGPCLGMVGSLRKIKLELGGDNLQLAINGKAINIMFGTDVPKLVAMITRELELTLAKEPHVFYEITELQPIELEQLRVKNEAIQLAEKIELEESKRKRIEYLKYVTDTIMENLPDIGITVFGPQVNRDMFKKLSEPADPLKIQCKDRKVFTITQNDFNTVNFAAEDPLEDEVQKYLYDKELLMCFWKVEETMGSPQTVLHLYAHELTKETIKPPDEFNEEETIIPPLIVPIEITIEVQIDDKVEPETEETNAENVEDTPEEGRKRTHAALIYTYFRAQTSSFLPPDPTPEPPHIIMTFDAYKKKDLMNLVDACRDDVPLYGFFNSDNPQTATFIANSVDKYNAKPYVPTDKIVLKVNKVPGETIPLLMEYGPSYVSPNSVVGFKEAAKFFPPTYKSALQEEAELHAVKAEKPKKRKKNKKGADAEDIGQDNAGAQDNQQEADEAAKTSPEEGASTTSSGEDSCESRPATADGNNLTTEAPQ